MSSAVPPLSWDEARLAIATRDPALAALLIHDHECLEKTKAEVAMLRNDLPGIITQALDHRARDSKRLLREWLTMGAAVIGALAAVAAAWAAFYWHS